MESSLYYLKEFGREEFQEKFFLAEYMQGSCVLSNIIWNINFKNIVKKKILEKNRSHCKHIQITIPGNLLKKC